MASVQLLVSVRNAEEATAAADGGADIIDVKDPDKGSLGFAGWSTIQHIQGCLKTDCVLSAALGELHEWLDFNTAATDTSATRDDLPTLQFAKIGLAGEAIRSDGATWKSDWQVIRKQFANVQQWVAVAYSDFDRCDAPNPSEVLDAAITTGCKILLLDTFVKDGKTTFDHLPEYELQALISRSQAEGIKVAIAGQVSANNISSIQAVRPDIVAVRGAVCESRDREKAVQHAEVVRLRAALDASSCGG